MKLVGSAALLALADARMMSRSQRSQLKTLLQIDLESDHYDNVDSSIISAFQAYVNAPEFAFPADVPDMFADWYNVQTGRTECVEGCETGVLEMSPLFGYGCWCFFGNIDSTLGRGPPIDAFDQVCKDLALCFRCIHHDAENEGDEGCDPYNTKFQSSVAAGGMGSGLYNMTTSCQTDNVANCSWRTCACSMKMVAAFFNLAFNTDQNYDEKLKHSNGFDYYLECPAQGKSFDRQCCGYYPDRRTYDRGEARDCCHEQTIYNPLRHQCCSDGSKARLGESC